MSSDNLYQRIMKTIHEKTLEVEFLATSKMDFNSHYKTHKDQIAKCGAWALYSEDGMPLEQKSMEIGFAQWGNINPENPPEGIVKIPYHTLNQVGYNEGDIVNDLTLFLELENQSKINVYVAKSSYRLLPKKEWQKLEDNFRLLAREDWD
jgi:hypothetical protein